MTTTAGMKKSPSPLPARAEAAPDWAALREQFPTTERFVYLDSARKAILPRSVEAAIGEWLADVYERAGKDAFSMERVEDARRAVAGLIGAPAGTVALIKNTSEGINILAQGLGLKTGDNVLVSLAEHENNTFPWRHLGTKGVEIRWVRPAADGRVPLSAYADAINADTRAVAAAWVTYGNGFRTDVPALGALCRDHGARLIVDGVQGVGVIAAPLADLGADAVVCGGHKGMLSLAGAGFMYVREDLIGKITPPYAAKYSFTSNDRMQDRPTLSADAHRFEYGNPNYLGIWVQGRSAEYLMAIGLENIEARVRELTTRLIEGAGERGIVVRTPRPWRERAGIVSFEIEGNAEAIAAALAERNIIVSVKDGHIRASVQFYNDEVDLERFLDAVTSFSPS